jgi:radical SAM superfamily enzyme YgiQ (UPF0313 family)
MKKLLLISPQVKNSLMAGGMMFRLPNLGLLRVAALTPPDWEVKIVDEKIEPLDLNQPADLVGITTMTTTVKRGYEIADHFRRRGVKVIMGGMHASCLPQEALQHCDTVVVGEAEKLWPVVLSDLARNAIEPVYRHGEILPPLVGLPPNDWKLFRPKKYLPIHFMETTAARLAASSAPSPARLAAAFATVRKMRFWPS